MTKLPGQMNSMHGSPGGNSSLQEEIQVIRVTKTYIDTVIIGALLVGLIMVGVLIYKYCVCYCRDDDK